MDKWTIAMIRFKHRNGFYDTKNDSYPIPRLEFFEEKSSRFISIFNNIYILFNRVHFVRHFVSQKEADVSDCYETQLSDM